MDSSFVVSNDWKSAAAPEIEKYLRKLTDEIASDARALAPSVSGRLRDSIKTEVNGWEARVEATAPYAHVVEVGDSNQPAEPYLAPATYRTR